MKAPLTRVFRSSHQILVRKEVSHRKIRCTVEHARALPKELGQDFRRETYHSALGYFLRLALMKSTFSQLSRHSCAYRFFVLMSTISRS